MNPPQAGFVVSGAGETDVNPMRNASGKITAAMLRDRVLALRVTGLPIRQIAKKVGRSTARVHQILVAALEDLHAKNLESTQHLVELELDRLDELLLTHWPKRRFADNAGVVLRIMDRRAHLQGLDKPTKTEIGGFDGAPLVPPVINIGFTNGGPGKPSDGGSGAEGS